MRIPKARREEDDARGGRSAYEAAAEKAAAAAGTSLDRDRARAGRVGDPLGTGDRCGRGLRRCSGAGSRGWASRPGPLSGTAFWGFLDEGMVPALGLTPGPTAFPWQAHARGLVGHLTFGTVTEGTLRLLDRVA